jgi:hypothetical protein
MGTDNDWLPALEITEREPAPRMASTSTPGARYLNRGYLGVRGMSVSVR